MTGLSVLHPRIQTEQEKEITQIPEIFRDLNLDQVVDAICEQKDEYRLAPYFYTTLHSPSDIYYRHQVFKDLETPECLLAIEKFAAGMREMRLSLSKTEVLYYECQKQWWFLNAVSIYCDVVSGLNDHFSSMTLVSDGLSQFRDYLDRYVISTSFCSLQTGVKQLNDALAQIHYCLLIQDSHIVVGKYDGERDYTSEVAALFAKFKQHDAKDYRTEFNEVPHMNHVEAKIVELVADFYPDVFTAISEFISNRQHYLDDIIAVFDREIQFYLAYITYITPLKEHSLKFCFPVIHNQNKELTSSGGFDVALAKKLIADGKLVISNDFYLKDPERILIVTGPNQGGKTTFARLFGQLHYLAALGLPVPGYRAELFLFDAIYTHFEREENLQNLHSKLQDELLRIHDITDQMTSRSIVILNEIFTSTTSDDAFYLSQQIMEKIQSQDVLCVWVTFIDELVSLTNKAVSMVSTVDTTNPAIRTFRIVRKPADGQAYALSIAEKYKLTYLQLMERIVI